MTDSSSASEHRELAEIIEELAPVPRLPASAGEREAAEMIGKRFVTAGCAARIEEVPAYDSYARPLAVLCAAAAAAGLFAGGGKGGALRRAAGFAVGAAAAAGVVDDITVGRMLARRALMPPRTTTNVIAETGDGKAVATLVVLVHHDAAPSGVIFNQDAERIFASRLPQVVDAMTSNPPMWWPVIAGPALVGAGSLTGSKLLRRTGVAVSALAAAALADIATRPAVPGANDNLSGVAAAIVLARRLRDNPVTGLRVLFVSAGAEEALQQGIRGYADRHFGEFDKERTWFLTLDTVGSGRLVMLEGEGTVRMHDYGASFKNLVASCAEDAGVTLLRGLRSRNSTDGCVPNHYGFRSVSLVSVDDQKLLPNYHLYSDIPENVDYRSVADAVTLCEAVARRLGRPSGR
ncbi:MAG TPA: M28 family peptidase [Trebonia sp.]